MHYSEKKSRRVLRRFRSDHEGWYRKTLPFFMAFVLVFILYVIITEAGNPWSPRLVGMFMLGMYIALFRYLRPDLHFELYRRYWPFKLHPMVQVEADSLYHQLRQLAFSMGEPRAEPRNRAPGSIAEPGEAR